MDVAFKGIRRRTKANCCCIRKEFTSKNQSLLYLNGFVIRQINYALRATPLNAMKQPREGGNKFFVCTREIQKKR